jgi:hypothetical protein
LARSALGPSADARQDLRKALSVKGRAWVHGRTHLELGKILLKAKDPRAANAEFRQAVTLCESDNDRPSANEARRLIR